MKKLVILSFAILFVYQINAQTFFIGNYLSPNSIELSEILQGLMPQVHMGSSSDLGPFFYVAILYKEEDVAEKILDLIQKGVRTDSLKIIGFKKPSEESITICKSVSMRQAFEVAMDLKQKGAPSGSISMFGYKNPSKEIIGEFGRVVSVREEGDGITLIEYCEVIHCKRIANILRYKFDYKPLKLNINK